MAAAEQEKREKEGLGAAAAIKANLDALAEGYKKIATDTGCTGQAIVASETAKAVAGNVDTLNCFGSSGMAELLKTVTAVSTVVRAQGRQPKPTTP